MAKTIKVYEGNRAGRYRVTVNGAPLRHVCRHSPDGFEWGYGGSGPADLARSILIDCLGQDRADRLYQDFKWSFVSRFQFKGWKITSEQIESWADKFEADLAAEPGLEPDGFALVAHIEGKDGLE